MKKLYVLTVFALLTPILGMTQMVFTGGPVNTSGQCWALWASNDSAFMGYNDGLYRTVDGGVSWEHLTNGIAFDADPRTIEYAEGLLVVGTNDGSRIYKSTDFGDTFIGGTGSIVSFAIPTASASGNGSHMIGGTVFDPNYYDFGANDWVSTGNGGSISHGMRHMGGDTIWICSGNVSSGTTSYSHDNGLTWTNITTEPETDVGGGVILSSVAQDFLKVGNRILVGTNLTGFPVLFTDDYGATWQASNLPSTTWSDYGKRFIKINDNHLLTVNLSGVWKSIDQGATWTLIQTIPKIRTMTIFNGNHLLVGTDNGVCEFDNYGEGALIKKHGSTTSASSLLAHSGGTIMAGTENGIHHFDPLSSTWSVLKDTSDTGIPFNSVRLSQVGDTIYALGPNGYYKSGDGGATFTAGSNSLFNNEPPTVIQMLDGKKFASSYHDGGGSPQPPTILYSSDNGVTYATATFSNTPSYGYGGTGGNFVERFLETPNALIADMNAGYAISVDGGINWTFYGGVWDISFLAVDGTDIYHYRATAVPFAERVLEVSTDDGNTWTDVSQTGMPNGGVSNYFGFWGVWNLDGNICTYNSYESPRGIYSYNTSTSSWNLIPGSAASIEDWDGITSMHEFNGDYYANWYLNGTWKTGGAMSNEDLVRELDLSVFPNPTFGKLSIDYAGQGALGQLMKIDVFDLTGKIIYRKEVVYQGPFSFEINAESGVYMLVVQCNGESTSSQIVKM